MLPKGQLVNRLTGFHPHFNASCNSVEIKPHLASDKSAKARRRSTFGYFSTARGITEIDSWHDDSSTATIRHETSFLRPRALPTFKS